MIPRILTIIPGLRRTVRSLNFAQMYKYVCIYICMYVYANEYVYDCISISISISFDR